MKGGSSVGSFIGKVKKYIGIGLVSLFNLFPIKNNKVFMFSYYGSQYGCNPKYISEYMLTHYPRNKFDIVWAFNNLKDKQGIEGIRKVKTMSVRYFYELCTSKVVITNYRTTDLFKKRKEQYYIQTWHSSLRLKKIEKDAEKDLPQTYIQMAKKDSQKCDLLLSGCKYSTEIFRRSFWYEGEIFEQGSPRNDLLVSENVNKRKIICDRLGIRPGQKILLYAPTFRKNNDTSIYKLDFNSICHSLVQKFGGDWVVLAKLHPHLLGKSDAIFEGQNVTDVTTYDDIQELLLVSDVLISDYSSLMFDFAVTRRPCFLYTPDLEQYMQKERELYFTMDELPFLPAQDIVQLNAKIEEIDLLEYQMQIAIFLNKVGSFDQGKSSQKLINRILEVCFDEERSNVLEAV